MQREESHSESPYDPFPKRALRTREEALAELRSPAGRFRDPTPSDERLRLFLAERLRPMDPMGDGQLFLGGGVPLQWQHLLHYLRDQGIISHARFEPIMAAHDRPHFPEFSLALDPRRRPTDGRVSGYAAFGTDTDRETAMAKAVGEALERYFLSLYKRSDLLRAARTSLERAGTPSLDLGLLNGFLPFQKEAWPVLGADEHTELYWVEGERYPDGVRTLLPAQLVFWNYRHREPPPQEQLLARITTSGCAGHFTKEEAVLAGLLELIERDAFLIFWLNRIAPPVLDVSGIDDAALRESLAYAERCRLKATFLNTTSDIRVPTVACVVEDARAVSAPVLSLGSASGFSLGTTLRRALLEALATNRYTAARPPYELPDSYAPFTDAALDRTKRLSLWRGKRMAERFSFFTSGKKQDARELARETEAIGASAQLAYVLRELRAKGPGYETYIYEKTDRVLGALGFHAVRVIVPRLIPMYLREFAAPLDAVRLREVPAMLGYQAAEHPNPWPHPFP
jgi:ribosomal protein S12 methylthiotransferase accessory factor